MIGDLALMTATELVRLYRARTASPVEATRAALDRIARLDPRVNAFCLVDERAALSAARDSEKRWMRDAPTGLVDGVPTTIKDLFLTAGWPTLRGSRTTARKQRWREDAPSVARLRAHGAVFLGKTTTPELGWKGVTDSPLTGVTRNPWDLKMTSGGSSGGAAVAAALGMGALHLGTDGGGSIRIPASFSGIVGMKPSYGRVPVAPASAFLMLSHAGPMTRSVADAALMLTVLAEPDDRDWYALPHEPRDWRIGLDDGIRGLRIAFSPRLGNARVDREVANAVKRAVAGLADQGAIIEEADPDVSDAEDAFRTLWFTGAANMLRSFPTAKLGLVDPGLLAVAEMGASTTALEFTRAIRQREALGERLISFHRRHNLLVTPTIPIPAFAAGVEVPPGSQSDRWTGWTPFSYPFNLTGQPAISLPCGLTRAGLPIGLQIVGPRHRDDLVLRAARAFESTHPVILTSRA
ncbi:MAG: amidase [Alphaproteobacteria bacterium]|nr:amidase [Alphaproteobacteria bacterium]